MGELQRALNRTGKSAPGKDKVCYSMLKHLSIENQEKLLMLYNRVWEEGRLPKSWKEAVIIPIRKPGKDPSKPGNYRPIALTSHICKLMERMINERLMYFLESKDIIASCQSGFRKGRNTIDSVINLEDEIRKAQVNKETVGTVFFDVEKAYDMMWREGLLIKLHLMGVGGKMFNWIMDFLNGRVIQVKIGQELSNQYNVENGTPQGSVISPILFSIMINDIYSELPLDMGRSLFADDGAIWKRGRNGEFIKRKLQNGINQVEQWGTKWGFKFSVEKTKVMLFTNKKKDKECKVEMYGTNLEKVECFRFLGVYFDTKLTWREHIKYTVCKCKKVLNVMRCLAGLDWGASFSALKYIYIALIRSKLDYGCIVYGSAAKSVLTELDVVQTQALRICLGAIRTSPVCSLQVEAGEMPLWLRRKHLVANYWIHLRGHGDNHPTKKVLQNCWEKERRKKESFGWTGDVIAKEMGVYEKEFASTVVWTNKPIWTMENTKVDIELLIIKGCSRSTDIVSEYYRYMDNMYKDSIQIFTDGSKDLQSETTGSAVYIPSHNVGINKRTSDSLSVYTVELYAILLALEWTEQSGWDNIVICSDSVSALMSIKSGVTRNHQELLYEILFTNSRISRHGKNITYLWVPAHVGIQGNERVDRLAKEATKKGNIDVKIKLSKTEGKSLVWKKIMEKWQQQWDNEIKGRHLYMIQNRIGMESKKGGNRKEQVIINRLRIGHCKLNKTLHIIGKHPTGLCDECQEEETVNHIFISCKKYILERLEFKNQLREIGILEYNVKNIVTYGNNDQGRRYLFNFLRRTGLERRV